jgi:hypothetical protein
MIASIAIPFGHRKIARIAMIVAAAAGAVGFPIVGIPLVLGIATYAAIILRKPNQIIRGRFLSLRQQCRAAVIAAGGITAVAALSSGMLVAIDLATVLEHRLRNALAITHSRGELKPGQILAECQTLVCAQATVIKLATPSTFGIAKLNGFAMHDQAVYHWHETLVQPESSSTQR